MAKRDLFKRMLQVSTIALMFGAASAYAQSTSSGSASTTSPAASGSSMDSSGTSGSGTKHSKKSNEGARSKDAPGKTKLNREGKMSPTGQNETTSAAPQEATTGTSGASGARGASSSK